MSGGGNFKDKDVEKHPNEGNAAELTSPLSQSTTLAEEVEAKRKKAQKAIRAALCLCLVFMVVEVIGGWVANSLAILTDAAHLLTDAAAFGLSLFALHLATRQACKTYSYGWHRAEVVGTLASVFTIWMLVGAILIEAMRRIDEMMACAANPEKKHCSTVDAPIMAVVGTAGLFVNIACAAVLNWGNTHGHSHSHAGHDDDHGHEHGHSHGDDEHEHEHGHEHAHGDDEHGHEHGHECVHDDDHCSHEHDHGHEHAHSHGEDDHEHDHGHQHGHADARDEDQEDAFHDEEEHGHGHGTTRVKLAKFVAEPDSHASQTKRNRKNNYGSISPPADENGSHGSSKEKQGKITGVAKSLALNAAFLHALGDSIQSLGVVLAAAVIWVGNLRTWGKATHRHSYYNVADPACSILFALITLWTTKGLFLELVAI